MQFEGENKFLESCNTIDQSSWEADSHWISQEISYFCDIL
jgi:hypothetical protein